MTAKHPSVIDQLQEAMGGVGVETRVIAACTLCRQLLSDTLLDVESHLEKKHVEDTARLEVRGDGHGGVTVARTVVQHQVFLVAFINEHRKGERHD